MTACVIVIYGRSSNSLSGLVFSDSKAFDILKTMLTLDKTFELEYGFSLSKRKPKTLKRISKALAFTHMLVYQQ